MKLKYRLLKIALSLSLLIFMWWFSSKRYNEKLFSYQNIHSNITTEQHFVVNENINTTIEKTLKKNIQYAKIGDVQTATIEQKLKENPYIDSTNVYLNQRGKLFIFVRQKEPIARINTEKESYYLTQKAEKCPLSSQYSKECLLFTGNIKPAEYAKIVALAQYITMDKLLKKHIIGVRKENDFSFILLVNNDFYTIDFGDLNNVEDKFNALKGFYTQYLNHVGLQKYSEISLKYKNQVVATKNEQYGKQ